ncbi:MAG: metallophosphoesterase [Oscillospiraceae bacterium]|nr:metallophosphoesterase [Oscillospiraceae bacterium]MBQ3499861.1 metallophosphoesterase [Oscillospiraceae bacterium]
MKKYLSVLFAAAVLLLLLCSCSSEEKLDIVHVTDIHFAGREYFDYEGIYAESNDSNGSGKQMKYLDDILDAFIEEMKQRKPDYIIVTGDSTYAGAKESHLALTEKLRPLLEKDIKILVLPGNHDIEMPTYIYPNGGYEETVTLAPDEYREVYADFGYSGGISYDPSSLSYVYDTGMGVRIFMLDTNVAYGMLYGSLNNEKMAWLEKELAACKEAGDTPLVAGHHTVLEHNKRFNFGYRLNNSADVEALLADAGCTLYLCGHMHTQHIVSDEYLTDIVGGAFSVYPHRYGVIEFSKTGWNYESLVTDVDLYVEKTGSENPDLLNYSDYGYAFFYNNAYSQGKESLSYVISDTELLEKYADFTAKVNVAYFGGVVSDLDLSFAEQFLVDAEGSSWCGYVESILNNPVDHISCSSTKDDE